MSVPPVVRPAMVALLAAAVPLSAYLLFFRGPKRSAVEALESRLEGGARELRALEITTERLSEFRRESDLVDERLALLEKIRPAAPATDAFVERVREVCREQALEVLDAKALPPGAESAAIELRVAGTPAAVSSLLERLYRLARLNRVDRIALLRRGGARSEFELRILTFHRKAGAGR